MPRKSEGALTVPNLRVTSLAVRLEHVLGRESLRFCCGPPPHGPSPPRPLGLCFDSSRAPHFRPLIPTSLVPQNLNSSLGSVPAGAGSRTNHFVLNFRFPSSERGGRAPNVSPELRAPQGPPHVHLTARNLQALGLLKDTYSWPPSDLRNHTPEERLGGPDSVCSSNQEPRFSSPNKCWKHISVGLFLRGGPQKRRSGRR